MLNRTRTLLAQSYAKALNLPRSTFPPRPDVTLRPTLLKQCTDDLYDWQATHRPGSNTFTLHDGPPYANGPLHIGHALNKVLKDVFNRFQCSQGKLVSYRPGWDCHGLPIELKALQGSGMDLADRKGKDTMAVRQAARQLASRAVEEQMSGFKSWGVMGDWSNSYKTMDVGFQIKQLEVFREIVSKGLIHRQYKPVYWSPSSRTALAEAELEYDDNHISRAAYVAFEVVDVPEALQKYESLGKMYALTWTTTPWTLPANKAIALHNNLEYIVIRYDSRQYLLSTSRLEDVLNARGLTMRDITVVVEGLKGTDLLGGTYRNPLHSRSLPQPLVHANFVSGDSGTGLVHSAPGHGFDDYNTCEALGIVPFAPVDDAGCFTKEARPEDPASLQGVPVLETGSQRVLDLLDRNEASNSNYVWAQHEYKHKYPIDWRTKRPLIVRATAQWFANVDEIKAQALGALNEVHFTPESGKSRLQSFISGRSHWCISRQRAWGVPIPAIFRIAPNGKEEAIMTSDSVTHIISVIKERGIDAWWTDVEDDPAWIAPSLPSASYVRGKDTMDVWFDSGTTWTQIPQKPSLEAPADVYLEGTDQHRGWFQSSLLTRVACLAKQSDIDPPRAPFKRLITHGFILDECGRKMSKSLGNVVSPIEIMEGTLLPPMKNRKKQEHAPQSQKISGSFDALGPDALRLWAASNDYTSDVPVGAAVLTAVNTTLHKYRVTLKWLLGVLSDYTTASVHVPSRDDNPPDTPPTNLDLSDRLALHALHQTTTAVHAYYASFEPHKALTTLSRYATTSLSAFYFETAKDTLYTCPSADRSRVQAVCYEILRHMLAMLAPVTPLLVQETMHYAPPGLRECIEQRGHDPFRDVWQPSTAGDSILLNQAKAPSTLNQPTSPQSPPTTPVSPQTQATLTQTIRAELRIAQERIRTDHPGRMGSGLDCHVQLVLADAGRLPPAIRDFAQAVVESGELARALVVSSLELKLLPERDLEVVLQEQEQQHEQESKKKGDGTTTKFREDWVSSQPLEATLQSGDDGDPSHHEVKLVGKVVVMPPRGDKCPRCWRFVVDKKGRREEEEEVGEHRVAEARERNEGGDGGRVCGRCVEALAERAVEDVSVVL